MQVKMIWEETNPSLLVLQINKIIIKVKEKKIAESKDINKVVYLTKENMKKTAEGEILDELGLKNVCCRRHMLTHVDIE